MKENVRESYIKSLYSERVPAVKEKKAGKGKVENNSETLIIDFSLDEPDAMPDLLIIDALYKEASKWMNRGYGADKPGDDFNKCVERYMSDFFSVQKLDPETEISVTGGTTSALNLLSLAFINRGDAALITKPSATSLDTMTKWLGGTVIGVPLSQKNKFYPKYEEIPQKSLKKAKLLYINYPGNPTGQTATIDFFKETVDFAKLNNLIVLHDASFAPLAYDEGKRLSFLSAPGAKKVGAELHSHSYGFNMAGWRIGFIAGNKSIVKAFDEIKAKSGFGQYAPIQRAAAYALTRTDVVQTTVKKYERRMSVLTDALSKLGFKVKTPKAGFYIFVKAPKGTDCGKKFGSSRDFEKFLSAHGLKVRAFEEDYTRFSATFPALGIEEENRVIETFLERLGDYKFLF